MSPTPSSTSASGLTEILALAELVSNSVKDVVAEYSAAGFCLPSLSSTACGPWDSMESIVTRPKLAKAVKTLDAACSQLMFAVGSPGHVIANKCYGIQEPACMLVATDAKIADHLLDKPEGVHVDELSKLTAIDSGKLARVLRLLCTKHCFAEIKPNVFVNNRLSMKMVSSDPLSAFVGHMTDEMGRAALSLNETLQDPKMTHSQTPDGSPFTKAYGCKAFDFYASHPAYAMRFNRAMTGLARVTGNGMLGKVYPWATLPKNSVVCDVGGGYGHHTIGLLKEFPHLKIVVQDLPSVVEESRQSLADNKDLSVALKQRVEHIPLDFFKDSPVKRCDVYYLSHIIHDWPLAECKKILDNIRTVAKPSSRLLIHEFVLQYAAAESGTNVEKAPEPLLPNWGIGCIRPYNQDINMMSCLNSQERTLAEFIEIGAASGFEFAKLWDIGEAGVVEFKLMAT
ncbi:S-adenosyl-L-methionine-dependent methyltransferase [Roridomyces roridus]|uniref:S-adenosyl-L-methionine-dependent methyltransferase n=1 Tax=Roridomyces roridus TaxID=1738132 RepID=A0AAD7BYS0_9AGAR|nr:S-adenosyl-L-methionine-dependent methyltransferase [Roridomyces roridus]